MAVSCRQQALVPRPRHLRSAGLRDGLVGRGHLAGLRLPGRVLHTAQRVQAERCGGRGGLHHVRARAAHERRVHTSPSRGYRSVRLVLTRRAQVVDSWTSVRRSGVAGSSSASSASTRPRVGPLRPSPPRTDHPSPPTRLTRSTLPSILAHLPLIHSTIRAASTTLHGRSGPSRTPLWTTLGGRRTTSCSQGGSAEVPSFTQGALFSRFSRIHAAAADPEHPLFADPLAATPATAQSPPRRSPRPSSPPSAAHTVPLTSRSSPYGAVGHWGSFRRWGSGCASFSSRAPMSRTAG